MICDDVKCRCDDTVVPKFSLSNTPPWKNKMFKWSVTSERTFEVVGVRIDIVYFENRFITAWREHAQRERFLSWAPRGY